MQYVYNKYLCTTRVPRWPFAVDDNLNLFSMVWKNIKKPLNVVWTRRFRTASNLKRSLIITLSNVVVCAQS